MNSIKKYTKQLKKSAVWINSKSPIRSNFIIILLLLIISSSLARTLPEEASRFSDLFRLLLKLLSSSLIVLPLISLISVIIPYNRLKKKNTAPTIEFEYPESSSERSSLFFKIFYKVLRPLGGYLRIELIFDNKLISPKYTLWKKVIDNEKGYYGAFNIELPEIRHYNLLLTITYFEDFFRFFSLRKEHDIKASVTTFPTSLSQIDYSPNINDHKEDVFRTETIHAKEGEWLRFKSFEPSDDIRRIIWPIYAKNKQLVVRNQELQNMFASELTLLPLFSNFILDLPASEKLNSSLINEYKTSLWSLIQSIENNKEVKVCLLQDQILATHAIDDIPPLLNSLTGMQWQAYGNLSGNASIYCISSVTPMEEIRKLNLDMLPDIVFIKLSKAYNVNILYKLPRNIFFQINKAEHSLLQWWKSPYRKSILRNEREIKDYFKDRNNKFIEI